MCMQHCLFFRGGEASFGMYGFHDSCWPSAAGWFQQRVAYNSCADKGHVACTLGFITLKDFLFLVK